mgnify:CR=1 FL=1
MRDLLAAHHGLGGVRGPPGFYRPGLRAMRFDGTVCLGDTVMLNVKEAKISIANLPPSGIDFDPFLQFRQAANDFDIILLRSKTHFRTAREEIAAGIVIVDTPDDGPADQSA